MYTFDKITKHLLDTYNKHLLTLQHRPRSHFLPRRGKLVFWGRETPWNWQSESWVKRSPVIGPPLVAEPLLAAEPPQQDYKKRGAGRCGVM